MDLTGASLGNVNTILSVSSHALLVSIEDIGNAFDYKHFMDKLIKQSGSRDAGNNENSLIYELIETLNYHRKGNCVETIIGERL